MGNITTAFKNAYARNVYHLAQQKRSKLRSSVTLDPNARGEKYFVDQYGARSMQQILDRNGDSPLNKQNHDRRLLTLADFEDGDLIDKPDLFRTLDDPTNPIVAAQSMAAGRKIDELLVAAAEGTAYSGKDGTTSNTLGAGQTVAVDYNETASPADANMTVNKLRRAATILRENELDDDMEEWHLWLSPSNLQSLLRDAQTTNQDYGVVRALVRGEIDSYLRFKFHITNRLTLATGNVRTALAVVKSKVIFGLPQEPVVKMDPERSDKRFNPYVYIKMTMGATRLEEVGVVKILCDEDL